MEAASRAPERTQRVGGGGPSKRNKVCIFWRNGKCRKNPCRFIHGEMPQLTTKSHPYALPEGYPRKSTYYHISKNTLVLKTGESGSWSNVAKKSPKNLPKKFFDKYSEIDRKNSIENSSENVPKKSPENIVPMKFSEIVFAKAPKNVSKRSPEFVVEKKALESVIVEAPESVAAVKAVENVPKEAPENIVQTSSETVPKKSPASVCQFWLQGNCVLGDQCQHLHSWFRGDEFTILGKLHGHKKAVTGIVLPERTNKLFSGSSDGTVQFWDCNTGQCDRVVDLGVEVGTIISEGPWVFVGLPNVIKAWNTESAAEYNLDGPVGQVNAMAVVNDLLFAGIQDGVILAWKGSNDTNPPFQLAASLKGHSCDVTSLVVGGKRLYSGSVDRTIRVWDHETLQCIMTLNGHTDVVTSLICWDRYLFSCSLDCTVKIWAANEEGSLEEIYTHNEEHGVLALRMMTNAHAKPILYCSCGDRSVRLYEMPSFTDRGQLYAKQEVGSIQLGPGGLFFTGDRTGLLTVWKWCS